MLPRALLTILAIFGAYVAPAQAQLPKRLERCLPNPTLAQEIRDMWPPEPEPPAVYLRVVEVKFDPDSKIPQGIQDEIVKNEVGQTHEVDANSDYLKDMAAELAEVSVRGSLQAHGYFKPSVEAKASVLKTKGPDIDVSVTVSAEPGDQYRIGTLTAVAADPDKYLSLISQRLIDEFHLSSGEIMNVDEIREGLRRLTKIYRHFGFIDMTAEPNFKIDEAKKLIDITISVDEQRQYFVTDMQFLGVDSNTEQKLRSTLPRGTWLFDSTPLENFFKENRSILPADATEDDVEFHRNPKEATVTLLFDLRSCPGAGI